MNDRSPCRCLWHVLIALVSLPFITGLNGCGSMDTERNVRCLMDSGLRFPEKFGIELGDYNIVRYVRPASCTSCQLKLGQWKIHKRRLESKFGARVQFRFVIDTKLPDEAEFITSIYGFDNSTTIDTAGDFIHANPILETLGDDVTMLVDSTGMVLLVGNPCKSTKMDSLYQGIISNSLKRNHLNIKL